MAIILGNLLVGLIWMAVGFSIVKVGGKDDPDFSKPMAEWTVEHGLHMVVVSMAAPIVVTCVWVLRGASLGKFGKMKISPWNKANNSE